MVEATSSVAMRGSRHVLLSCSTAAFVTMQHYSTTGWERARIAHLARLNQKDRLSVTRVTSQEELIDKVRELHRKYSGRTGLVPLRKADALIAQLRSFTQIINIFVQANDFGSLVWGPLALILEVSSQLYAFSYVSR